MLKVAEVPLFCLVGANDGDLFLRKPDRQQAADSLLGSLKRRKDASAHWPGLFFCRCKLSHDNSPRKTARAKRMPALSAFERPFHVSSLRSRRKSNCS